MFADRGMDQTLSDRLKEEGVTDDAALAAWLGAHPNGTERIGRVMLAELRLWLEERLP